MSRFTGHREPWGTYADAKVNIAAVLKKQLNARRVPEGRVIISSVTDAYQPAEAHYRLTKSALVVRDLSILKEMPRCSVGFTLTTVDEKVARVFEPGAPPPGLRLAAARQLVEAGIAVWVFVAPVLPGVGDSEKALSALFKELKRAGVKDIMADTLNPYPAVLQRLKKVYRTHFPAALADLELCAAEPGLYQERVKKSLRLLGAGLI
jgi:DNA repair photolyase